MMGLEKTAGEVVIKVCLALLRSPAWGFVVVGGGADDDEFVRTRTGSTYTGIWPTLELTSPRLTRLSLRVLSVFNMLQLHAHAEGRTVLLTLDPTDYVYPRGLLSHGAAHMGDLAVKLHALNSKLANCLLIPIVFGERVPEIPSFSGLSDSLLLNICAFLTAQDLLGLDLCNRRLHSLSSSDKLWTEMGLRDFLSIHQFHLVEGVTMPKDKNEYFKLCKSIWERRGRGRGGLVSVDDAYWAGSRGRTVHLPPFPPLQPQQHLHPPFW